MSVSQYEYWKHTHLTVDVVKGRGSGFSVEAPEGVRFLIRSRLLTDEELAAFGIAAHRGCRLRPWRSPGGSVTPSWAGGGVAAEARRSARPDRARASATKPLALSSSTSVVEERDGLGRTRTRRADGLPDLHERLVDDPESRARGEGGEGSRMPAPTSSPSVDEDVDTLVAAHERRVARVRVRKRS